MPAQPNSADDTGREDVARRMRPRPLRLVETAVGGHGAPEDGREVPGRQRRRGSGYPAATTMSTRTVVDAGTPQPECHDYADLDPVDLDQPHQPVCGGATATATGRLVATGHTFRGCDTPPRPTPTAAVATVSMPQTTTPGWPSPRRWPQPEPGCRPGSGPRPFAPAAVDAAARPTQVQQSPALGFAGHRRGNHRGDIDAAGHAPDPTADTGWEDPTTQISVVAAP